LTRASVKLAVESGILFAGRSHEGDWMRTMPAVALLAVLGALTIAAAIADAQTAGNARSGRRFALEVCTPCHVVTPDQVSPQRFSIGPDFRTIANTAGMTETALHLFLTHPHPRMPNLILSPQEQDDVVAYILTLRDRP
jgi:mono/diheme cytochrome c family protein